jgi:hypothetical protein
MTRTVIAGALLLFALTLGWSIATSGTPLVAEQDITYRPIQVAEDGYVSSTACRACHPAQYDAWHGSFHRTMTQLATAASVRADFDNVRVDAVRGNPIALERRGAEYWAEFGDPEWRGAAEGRHRISRQIVMITGSHHQQVYWYRTDRGRVLGQLPAMYLIAEQRWIPRDAALLHPAVEGAPPETGRWNAVCVNCHATNGKRRFDAPPDVATAGVEAIAADTRVAELGIACEACHGPAGEHVRQNGSPLRRYAQYLGGEADSAIVQPARLGSRLSSQVCGQCHAVWEHFDQAAERQANARGVLYRPGDDLADTRFGKVSRPPVPGQSLRQLRSTVEPPNGPQLVALPCGLDLGGTTLSQLFANLPAVGAEITGPAGVVSEHDDAVGLFNYEDRLGAKQLLNSAVLHRSTAGPAATGGPTPAGRAAASATGSGPSPEAATFRLHAHVASRGVEFPGAGEAWAVIAVSSRGQGPQEEHRRRGRCGNEGDPEHAG